MPCTSQAGWRKRSVAIAFFFFGNLIYSIGVSRCVFFFLFFFSLESSAKLTWRPGAVFSNVSNTKAYIFIKILSGDCLWCSVTRWTTLTSCCCCYCLLFASMDDVAGLGEVYGIFVNEWTRIVGRGTDSKEIAWWFEVWSVQRINYRVVRCRAQGVWMILMSNLISFIWICFHWNL